MTSGSNTLRRESGPQHGAPCGSTVGVAWCVQGPSGPGLVAWPMAEPLRHIGVPVGPTMDDTGHGRSVSVTVYQRWYSPPK